MTSSICSLFFAFKLLRRFLKTNHSMELLFWLARCFFCSQTISAYVLGRRISKESFLRRTSISKSTKLSLRGVIRVSAFVWAARDRKESLPGVSIKIKSQSDNLFKASFKLALSSFEASSRLEFVLRKRAK